MSTARSNTPPTETTITEHERQQCEATNAIGRPPVAFVHDPETIEQAKAHPEVFAGKSIGQVVDHFEQ